MSPLRLRPAAISLFVAAACLLMFACTAVEQIADTPAPVLLSATPKGGAAAEDLAVFPFLPAPATNTGAAVLILPAAGFTGSELDPASLKLARWLSARGITAFVFRSPPSAAAPDRAGADVSRALGALRLRAAEFKLSADRIGLLGFGRGAAVAAAAAYRATGSGASTPAAEAEKVSGRPAFLALVWGAPETTAVAADAPPTFLVGSTLAGDNLTGLIDLWSKLRAARVSVDAHFFAKSASTPDVALKDASPVTWPEMFYAWARFQGFLTDQPRLALKGMVYLDGHPLPQGYVVFTPVDFVGAGPIVARVINSTSGVPIGQFVVPVSQGAIAGRYKVQVRQNMNRWLSNAFSSQLVGGRGGATPEQVYFGHHRVLSPSIDDQHVFSRVRPGDAQDYVVEFKAGSPANEDLKIEVFTK